MRGQVPKTKYIPRYPWDRAPLGNFETVLMQFVREFHAENGRVPGKRTVMRKFGCGEVAALSSLRNLVRKGWLGEGGWQRSYLYLNDEPKD